MKTVRNLCIFLAAAFLLTFAVGCKNDSPAFQVNDVISDPGAFNGPVTVVGVTYGYSQSDPSIIGVMDKKELQCTTPNCEKVLLPVKTRGQVPALGAEVKISGAFTREQGGYLFHAESVEVLATHDLGGRG